jgi:repressor of nif and glnA expression
MEIVKTPSEAIKILWKEGVFFSPKKMAEVKMELKNRGYNFSDQAIYMALKRAKYLTKKGRRGSYTYVQKYPYVDEERGRS